jgi:prepilin signal peptidase PulO-like enzyme (type II secretory pathway)
LPYAAATILPNTRVMETFVPVFATALAIPGGWFAGALQHRLYREQEFRASPATGRAAWLIRGGLALACAIVVALAFRPDHYDFGPALLTALFGIAFCVMASTDFERRRITNTLSYPTLAAALLLCWAWPDRDVSDITQGAAAGMAIGAGMFALGVALGGPIAGLGLGDLKLIVVIGAVLGWPVVLYALFIGVLAAGVPGLVLTLSGRGKSYFSYGPYLALGAIIALLWPEHFM